MGIRLQTGSILSKRLSDRRHEPEEDVSQRSTDGEVGSETTIDQREFSDCRTREYDSLVKGVRSGIPGNTDSVEKRLIERIIGIENESLVVESSVLKE